MTNAVDSTLPASPLDYAAHPSTATSAGPPPIGTMAARLLTASLGDLDDHGQSAGSVALYIVICCVVRDVAMEQPFADPAGRPDHIIPLARPDVYGIREIAGRSGKALPVYRHDFKRAAMHMHRMNKIITAPDEAQLDRLANLHSNDVRRGVRFPVDREVIWESALHQHSGVG